MSRVRDVVVGADKWAALTKLPAPNKPSGTAPVLTQGTGNRGRMQCFVDNSWTSANQVYNLADFTPGARHLVASPILNNAAIVAFNFPVGVVCTLCQYQFDGIDRRPGLTDPNLAKCGATVDLIGTGSTEYVSLSAVGMNDFLSAFFWRYVDISLGAVELFQLANYTGARLVIFLCEWLSEVDVSLKDWFFNNRTSSVSWVTLPDDVTFVLKTESGFRFSDIWGGAKANKISNFSAYEKLNDLVTGFAWYGMLPVKEIISRFQVALPSTPSGATNAVTMRGTNSTSVEQHTSLTLEKENTATTEITIEATASTSFEASVSIEAGPVSASVSIRRDLSKRKARTTNESVRVNVSVTQDITIPAQSAWKATLTAKITEVPLTLWTATATRWYDAPLPNTVPDPDRPGWFVRDESLQGTISGGIVGDIIQEVTATAL